MRATARSDEAQRRRITPAEENVLRVLLHASVGRWLTAPQVALAVQQERLKVQGTLSSLCRAELVVRGEHRPMERTYAISTLGEAALDRLDQGEAER
jgi:hypothetical protein